MPTGFTSDGPGGASGPGRDAAAIQREWRGFLLGSLIVLGVAFCAIMILLGSALRQAGLNTAHLTARQMMSVPFSGSLMLVWLAGAIGLFVLNFRFSVWLGRPRRLRTSSWVRGAWLSAILVNSLVYASLVVPELALLLLFGRWVKQALAEAGGGASGARGA